MKTTADYSLVIPVYRNEKNIDPLLAALTELAKPYAGSLECVFVVDGSPDGSLARLEAAAPGLPFPTQLVELSRNFGSFSAIRAGLLVAGGKYQAVLAADLQEPLTLIDEFFRTLAAGEAEIVIGTRTSRADPAVSKTVSKAFWKTYSKVINPDIPPGGVDVFGCTAQVSDVLCAFDEANTSLIALLFWVGFERKLIPYDRQERNLGKSAWTIQKRLKYMADSTFAFSNIPIRLLLWLGTVGVAVFGGVSLVVFTSWALGRITVPGFTALMLALLSLGAVLLLALGIVGSYVWRTFENTKTRPGFIVSRHREFPGGHE